jgi:hypothetical protein
MSTAKIDINMDQECTRCGRPGALENGMCMSCTAATFGTRKGRGTIKLDSRMDEIKQKFLDRASELWDSNIEAALRIMDECDTMKVKLGYKAVIDFTEPTAVLETEITYSETHKEKETDMFDTPAQRPLLGIKEAQDQGRARGGSQGRG